MAPKGKNGTTDQNDDATTAEVERVINADVAQLRPSERALLDMLTRLEDIATEDTENRTFAGDDIARILLADTEDEMWEADELPRINAKVLSGCDLQIFGIEVKFSNDPEITTVLIGPKSKRKMYLLVHSVRLNSNGQDKTYRLPDVGEEFAWNTSARFIVAKLFWMASRGRFDGGGSVSASIVGTDLGGGKSVEKLKPLGMVTVAGSAEPPF